MYKADLRKKYRSLRDNISDRQEKSGKICNKVSELDLFKNCGTILAYMSIGSEVNMEGIIQQAYSQGKNVAFPRVWGKEAMKFFSLSFDEFHNGMFWEKSAFGVMEPVPGLAQEVESEKNTLIIVPGVVFSSEKHRIGYGVGYYDRFLSSSTFCAAVGVCYHEQISVMLKPEPHDFKLDFVITEREVF